MARIDLRRVAACRRALEKSRAELHASIVAAVDSGESQSDVARFAGYSQQRISQIVNEARASHSSTPPPTE